MKNVFTEFVNTQLEQAKIDALDSVAQRLILGNTDGNIIVTATGYDQKKIDAIAREMGREVCWRIPEPA